MNNQQSVTTHKKKMVAILLATYNGAQWLEQQIQSIFYQTHANWNLIAQDDHSTDKTLEILKNYSHKDPRFKKLQVSVKRMGTAARNFFDILTTLELSDYSYIAFCDQDDIWAPDKLERALYNLNYTAADGYSSDLVAFDDSTGSSKYIRKSNKQKKGDYLFQGASAGCTYVITRGAAETIKNKLIESSVEISLSLSHDWLIYAICRSNSMRWTHESRSFVFYRQHGANSYGANQSIRGYYKRLGMIREGWYRRTIIENGKYLVCNEWEVEVLSRVGRLSITDRIWLLVRITDFRRKNIEIFALGVMLIIGII